MTSLQEIVNQINAYATLPWLFPIRLVFIGITVVFLVFIIVILFRTSWIRFRYLFDMTEFLTFRSFGAPSITRRWQRTRQRLQTANEAEYKLAIIEADSVLGDVLLRLGLTQPTIADRLKNASAAIIPNVEQLWEAHRIRNNIVHDPDYRLTLEEANRALNYYEEAFRALDLIS